MIDERELEYLKPYSKLYENVLHINKAMERQEWKTAAKYCRDALAEMVMEKLKAVDGKCLIKCASVEFMSFIEDVYRSLRRREY